MSDSGDKIFPTDDYDYLTARSTLLLSLNMLRSELEMIWKEGKRWSDKKFDAYLQAIYVRKRELLDIAHGLMSAEDYQQYEDMVNSVLPLKYKKFDILKMKKIVKDFTPKKLV